ncbi:hypothetical protein [Nioella ostreopsis]|uniref:hypothetical protein n=1 Tax=Nioella ostreopsis TaxID=2448479 RepID=UPI000FDA1BEA|nr:hypothetical protein [Nioella ostreopsis]
MNDGFIRDETGATTVDWVVLSAGVVGLGIATSAAVITGTGDLSGDIRDVLAGVSIGARFDGEPMDAEQTALAVGLTNGGFDTDQPAGTWSLGDVEGWANEGSNGMIESWGEGFLGYSSNGGSTFIELDATRAGLDYVTTTVDLEAGTQYALSFEHAARSGQGVNDQFEVLVNDQVVAVIAPQTHDSFTTTTIIIEGIEGADRIGFREMEAQDNSVGILLDSVQLVEQ